MNGMIAGKREGLVFISKMCTSKSLLGPTRLSAMKDTDKNTNMEITIKEYLAFAKNQIKLLEKHLDTVVNGRKGVRFLFPLCGKAIDMKWLADMGHTVVGVEISEIAIQHFFSEQNLTYTEELVPAIPGAKLFKSSDGKITLYQCNLYDFSSSTAGKFGGIWDRGSLVAINPCDRQRYATLIISLMDKDCRYLLDTFLYNPSLYKGPPFLVPDENVNDLFGKACNIQPLESTDAFTEKQRSWGIDYLTEKVHLLTLKQK